MSSNGTGSSKWPDFRLASTLWSLMPGSQSNRPDKQNNNNDDAADHGHENEQQHESEHQNELHEELNQSHKVAHQDMNTEDQPIDGIGGMDNYEDDVQAGSDDGGQDQDFGVLEMFDSNATQAPYSSQINSAPLSQKAPEAFMTEEPPSTQIRKHKREKKERKRKSINDSASPQLPTEEDSSRKHRKSKKKPAQPVEIPDSLADNIPSNTYQSLPQQISAVDINDDGAAPATQTKRKRKPSDSADGKRSKKHRSRDDGVTAESQDMVPETQEGAQSTSEEVNTRDSEAASFLRTRNASRPGAIYDDVAEDTPKSPSAARLETRDAQSREGSVAHDKMELDASAAEENQDEDIERTGYPQYNGSQNSQDEDFEMVARQAWNEHVINAQNNSNAQDSVGQYDELEIPTSAQRPQTSHDVYDVPGSPVQTPNPPSTSTKKSRSAKAKKAKPTFFEKSPSPEQDDFAPLPSPSTTAPAPRKGAKKASLPRRETTRAQSMHDADHGNKPKKSRMADFTKGRFSDEELSRIARAVEGYRSAHNLEQYQLNEMIHAPGGTTASDEHAALWTRIFATCPDRHRQKIINITRKKFHNFVARGTWTTEQDEELRKMIEVHGNKWSKIAGLINRHPEDLRDRYRNYIICGDSQRKDTWDEDEEVRLTQHVMEMVAMIDQMRIEKPDDDENKKPYIELIDWQEISQRMGRTRSRLQCITKWRAMNINTHGKDKLVSKAPDASISFRLEKARRQIAAMPDEERYRMVMAIQNSSAQTESKIPWQRLVDKKFRASWHRPTQILLWRRLKHTVPGFQGKSLRDCASYLTDRYSQTGELPDVQDALYDDAEEVEFMSTIPMNHLPQGSASNSGQNMSAEFVNEADEEDDEHRIGEYGISDENIQPDLPIAPVEHLDPAPMASMDSVTPVADLAPMDPAEMVDPALSAEPVEAVETTPLEEEPASIEEEEVPIAKPVDTPEFVEPAPPKATRVARRTGMGKAKAPKTPRKPSARSTPAKATSTRRNTRRAAALSQDPIEDDGEAQLSAPADDNSEVDEVKTRKRKTPSRFRSTTAAELPTAADDSDSVMDDMEDMPARII